MKRVLRECVTCKREQGKPFREPPTAALPDFRVNEAPPIAKVGIDFAGPLFVKSQTGEIVKSYVVLFTCCIAQEVHLDLVTDLSVTTFVLCLRKFAARRGAPSLIMRDSKEVKENLESNRID